VKELEVILVDRLIVTALLVTRLRACFREDKL